MNAAVDPAVMFVIERFLAGGGPHLALGTTIDRRGAVKGDPVVGHVQDDPFCRGGAGSQSKVETSPAG